MSLFPRCNYPLLCTVSPDLWPNLGTWVGWCVEPWGSASVREPFPFSNLPFGPLKPRISPTCICIAPGVCVNKNLYWTVNPSLCLSPLHCPWQRVWLWARAQNTTVEFCVVWKLCHLYIVEYCWSRSLSLFFFRNVLLKSNKKTNTFFKN